jgi:hypothetical protein
MAQARYEILSQPKFEVVDRKNGKYAVMTVPSSDGKREYRVDITNQRCSCPAWVFSKERRTCKHLKAFGFRDLVKAPAQNYEEAL